jgi:hypothetical protein
VVVEGFGGEGMAGRGGRMDVEGEGRKLEEVGRFYESCIRF